MIRPSVSRGNNILTEGGSEDSDDVFFYSNDVDYHYVLAEEGERTDESKKMVQQVKYEYWDVMISTIVNPIFGYFVSKYTSSESEEK